MRLTVFLMLEAAPSWLALSRAERDRIAGECPRQARLSSTLDDTREPFQRSEV